MQSCSVRFHLYGCKLTKLTVDALWRTATQDASDSARCSASSEDGIVKHTAATPEELLLELGSPDRLENLTLSVHDGGLSDGRMVYVAIDARRAWISVEGPDETWIRGRAQQLEDILRRIRVRLGADPHAAPLIALMVFWLGSLGAIAASEAVRPMTAHYRNLLASLLIAAVAVGFLAWRWWLRRNTTIIALASATHRWSHGDRIGVAALVVAILSLALAAIQTWAAIRSR